MSQILKFEAAQRSDQGSRAMRRLRASGKIPAILYGHGQEPMRIELDARAFLGALSRHARFFDLTFGGTHESAIIREVQWDTYGQHVLHVDFLRVNVDEKVEITVPVELVGQAKGVLEGGVLEQSMTEIAIFCSPRTLPESLRVNVADLGLHQSILVKDVAIPEGAEHVEDLEKAVCTVAVRKVHVEETPAEGETAEPEVLGGAAPKEGEAKPDAKAGKE